MRSLPPAQTADTREGVLGGAPKAKILPVTVQGAEGTAIIAPDAVAAGIDWAVDHGADVINGSLDSSADADAMLFPSRRAARQSCECPRPRAASRTHLSGPGRAGRR